MRERYVPSRSNRALIRAGMINIIKARGIAQEGNPVTSLKD